MKNTQILRINISKNTWIGDYSYVSKNCSLRDLVVLGNEVFLPSNIKLKNVIVLDSISLKSKLSIQNAIVFKNGIYSYRDDKFYSYKEDEYFENFNDQRSLSLCQRFKNFWCYVLIYFFYHKKIKDENFLRNLWRLLIGEYNLLGISNERFEIYSKDFPSIKPSVVSYSDIMTGFMDDGCREIHERYYLNNVNNIKTVTMTVNLLKRNNV